MAIKYKIRFTKAARIEKAPEEGKGGYVVENIAVGTEMEVNDASLAFWMARGCVLNLGRVEESSKLPGFSPFGGQQPKQPEEPKPFTKTALKPVLDTLLAAFEKGDLAGLTAGLAKLDGPLIDDALADLPKDTRMVLDVAVIDAKEQGKVQGNPNELREALLDAVDVLLPPSRRARVKA